MTRNPSMIRFGIALATASLLAGCGGDLQGILDDVENGHSRGSGGSGSMAPDGSGGVSGTFKCDAGMQPSGVPCQVCYDPMGAVVKTDCEPFPDQTGMGGVTGTGGVTGMGGDPGMGGSSGTQDPQCYVKMTATGVPCKVCYDEMGAVTTEQCDGTGSMGPGTGTDVTCEVKMTTRGPCKLCVDAAGVVVANDCAK